MGGVDSGGDKKWGFGFAISATTHPSMISPNTTSSFGDGFHATSHPSISQTKTGVTFGDGSPSSNFGIPLLTNRPRFLSPPHWGRESSQIDSHPMGTPEPFSSWRHNSHASSHPMEKPEDHSTWTQTISPTGRVRPTTAWEHGGRPGGVARALCLRTSKTDSTRLKIGIERRTHTRLWALKGWH